jgi:medium-chain acyl-[acyl-carrier-protein] hydrolase
MTNPWFVRRQQTRHPNLRLFCFPYAGGSASIFQDWETVLPQTVELWAVQYPGRDKRMAEAPVTNLQDLASAIAREVEPHVDARFSFFGHSIGATVALEVARLLRGTVGIQPSALFVSGSRAPQLDRPDPPIYDLPDAQFREELRKLNGTPEDVLQHDELMDLLMPRLRADFAMNDTYTYVPDTPLTCPIFAYGGLADPDIARVDVDAWRVQTTGAFTIRMLPGDHFFIHSRRDALLRVLSADLLQVVGK